MKQRRWLAAGLGMGMVVAAACSDDSGSGGDESGLEDPGDCAVVDIASSPEKLELLEDLAQDFNGSEAAELGDDCGFVRVQNVASGAGMQQLADGWDEEVDGPPPVIWSPAASTWGAVLNHRLSEDGAEPLVDQDAPSFMVTPLVIAMPEPMAEALGWPDEPVGYQDILDLSLHEEGWGSVGHPEWGDFRLGRTNPNYSTSGLAGLVAQGYAATGSDTGLAVEDLDDNFDQFARDIESSVIHYGDTTLTFLENWYEADRRGNPFSYVSAVLVEEKSVIDYNLGNPSGMSTDGVDPQPPREPLVAIYPEEGTLYSDNPLYVLDTDWVDDDQQAAADAFVEFISTADNQERVLEYGFRPGNPDVAVGGPINPDNGVDPAPPAALLDVPEPDVLAELLADWADQRRGARVLMVLDVSGSMGEMADQEQGLTRLDLAQDAAGGVLDSFRPDDEIGLWAFSTDLGPDGDQDHLELVEPAPLSTVAEPMQVEINNTVPTANTPLYDVVSAAYAQMREDYDPERINAVIVLSDGEHADGEPSDDMDAFDGLLDELAGDEGIDQRPVRVFAIGYSEDADMATLRQIAQAASGAAYDATEATAIEDVMEAVISNF